MVQHNFFPLQSWLCAFSQLKQDKINRPAFPVPYQTQPFGFQSVFSGGGDQFRQPFRLVYQKKVPAEFQRPGTAGKQILRGTASFLPGCSQTLTDRACTKIGLSRKIQRRKEAE